MNSSSSSLSKSPNRCRHFSPSGRRCSQPPCSSHPTLCFAHKPPEATEDKLLLRELTQAAASLESPEDVSRVLGKIFVALLEDRISLKKAGTLGFLGQMLIRSHREIEYYKKTHRHNEQETAEAERHRLFLKEQDERKARLEAQHAEQRRADAEQAAQAAKEATKKAKAAAKAAKKEACEAAKKHATAAPPLESGSSTAAFCTNGTIPPAKGDRLNQAVIASQKQPAPSIVVTASLVSPQPPAPFPAPPPQRDLNHFYPIDPSLPPGRQDHAKNIPPLDAEELRWRELSRQYSRARRRH